MVRALKEKQSQVGSSSRPLGALAIAPASGRLSGCAGWMGTVNSGSWDRWRKQRHGRTRNFGATVLEMMIANEPELIEW